MPGGLGGPAAQEMGLGATLRLHSSSLREGQPPAGWAGLPLQRREVPGEPAEA